MVCHRTTSLEPTGVGRESVVVVVVSGVGVVAASSFRHHRVNASASANDEHANGHGCNDHGPHDSWWWRWW